MLSLESAREMSAIIATPSLLVACANRCGVAPSALRTKLTVGTALPSPPLSWSSDVAPSAARAASSDGSDIGSALAPGPRPCADTSSAWMSFEPMACTRSLPPAPSKPATYFLSSVATNGAPRPEAATEPRLSVPLGAPDSSRSEVAKSEAAPLAGAVVPKTESPVGVATTAEIAPASGISHFQSGAPVPAW